MIVYCVGFSRHCIGHVSHTIFKVTVCRVKDSRSYGDVYYFVYGVLCEGVGDENSKWVLVPVGDVVVGLL
jgi:hypothetical protein